MNCPQGELLIVGCSSHLVLVLVGNRMGYINACFNLSEINGNIRTSVFLGAHFEMKGNATRPSKAPAEMYTKYLNSSSAKRGTGLV